MTVLADAPPAREPRSPFQAREFRWLWSSTLAYAAAQGMGTTATAWLALLSVDAASGPLAVGFTLAARWAPFLIVGLPAGTVADRVYRPNLIRAVGVCGLVMMGLFSLVVASGPVPIWLVVGVSFSSALLQTFDSPSRQALSVDTVPRSLAPNALALNALASRLSSGVGAFIAGGLIATLGIASCYVAIVIAFGVAVLLASALRVPRSGPSQSERPTFRQALGTAASMVVNNPRVRLLTTASVACEIFAYSHISAVPILARDVLHAGPQGFGILNSASAFGGSVMILVLLAVPNRIPREPIVGTVYVVFAFALVSLAVTRDLLLTAAVLFLMGGCMSAWDTLQQTLIQLAVPEDQRGRAVGIWMFGIGSAPIGHVELGFMAGFIGAPGALLLNGAVVMVSAVTLLVRAPAFRWRPRDSSLPP